MILHGYDGPCAEEPPCEPGPTDEDICGAGGHAYAGNDQGRGRCYCGAITYPLDGPLVLGDEAKRVEP